jgi:diguanylate cyclase (GGDEF)-like protein
MGRFRIMAAVRQRSGHRPRTVALWLLPGFLATCLWLVALRHGPQVGEPLVLCGVMALFAIAVRVELHLEVQRQTYSLSPTETPLVIGLFLLPSFGLLLAWLAPAALLIADPRRLRGKQVFNLGVVALETGVAVVVFRSVHGHVISSPASWLIALLAAAAADLTASAMVALAITVTNGRMERRQLASVVVPTLVAGAVNATIGLIALVVIDVTAWGALLLVGVAAVFAMGFRAYGRFLRQHENLGRVYEFSKYVERARSDPSVLGDALAHARDMFNASAATLWTAPPGGSAESLVVMAAAAGPPQATVVASDGAVAPLRAVAMRSRRSRRFVTRDVTDARLRADLAARGITEAIVAPLRTGDRVVGTLELVDRQGQLASFGEDDLRLLDSLAAHLTAAIENQQLLDRLRHAAYHDRLTDLPNRSRLSQAIDEAIAAAGNGSLVALCQLDIDRFKEVNDSLGHTWGDELLARMGERIVDTVPAAAMVARVGADEFAVLTTVVDAAHAEADAMRLREAVSTPYSLAGLTIDVAVSAGVALAPEHAGDADTLMRRVDVALSNAKSTGRPVAVYHATMDQESLRRLRLVTQLREALANGEVVVRYQPKIALRSRELIGVEALVRWNHPEFGVVMPDDFVPVAEVTGLIGPLTMHVLRTAVDQCRRWLERDLRIGIAVNLSARSLVDVSFPDQVADLLRSRRVPTDLLTFELTESTVMSDPDRMKPVLHRLHALGVGLAVDDFGTGYSSMSQLRRLPVDEVKIDKEFVLSMGTDLGDLAIVRAIIELGHSLGLRVVAEGVEDELARDLLVGNDCDAIQGYLVSRALDPDRLDAWIAARTSARPAQPGVRGRRLQLTG